MTRSRVVRRLSQVLALSLVVSLAMALTDAQAAPRCFGKSATIVGSAGKDEILGTNQRDVIVGRGGNDTIFARDGDDLVCAGGGNDFVDGQGGRDRLKGNGGDDTLADRGGKGPFNLLQGNSGSDFLLGSNFEDKLVGGGGGVDVLRGRDRDDRLFGGGGFDALIGEGGNDLLNGGAGVFDRAVYFNASGPVIVNLAAGMASGAGNDTLLALEDIEGSKFGDSLRGDGGSNLIFGLGGDDQIDGAAGFDFAVYGGAQSGITANLDTGSASGQGSDTLISIEGLGGTDLADDFTGDEGSNSLFGFGGPDSLAGAAEDDLLDGGNGNDTGDGGTHVGGDRCLSIENASNCELFTAQKASSSRFELGAVRRTSTAILSQTS